MDRRRAGARPHHRAAPAVGAARRPARFQAGRRAHALVAAACARPRWAARAGRHADRLGGDRRAHRHWRRARRAHAQQRRERPAAHGEDGADHRGCARHSAGRTAGLRARRFGNPATHDRRVAAVECGIAATRGPRHRPLAGARAHGHDHRRAALHAEGGQSTSSGARSPSRSRGMPRAWPPRSSAWCLRSSGFR